MRALPLLCFLPAACSEGPAPIDAAVDAPAIDRDADRVDLGPPDRSRDRSQAPERRLAEARLPELSSPDLDPACKYLSIDEKVVECGGKYRYVLHPKLTAGPTTCLGDYWVVEGAKGQHATPSAAAAAAGCSTTCIWSAHLSVSALHCGKKIGYIIFEASGCPSLYQYPDGYYPSSAAYDAAHPCSDAGT